MGRASSATATATEVPEFRPPTTPDETTSPAASGLPRTTPTTQPESVPRPQPETLTVPGPGFGPLAPDSDPGPTTPGSGAAGPDGSAGDSDAPDARPRRGRSTSSRASLADLAQLRDAIAAGVGGAGVLANEHLTDEFGRAEDLYLTDERDRQGIATPAANLIARHTRGDLANPDLADAIAGLIAVGAYVAKQLGRWSAARRARRAAAAAGVLLEQDRAAADLAATGVGGAA